MIRAPVESDRSRLVEMFTDAQFTVFSDGVHDLASANTRFDQMVSLGEAVPYAKRPVIERETETIVGYTGVGTVVLEGLDELDPLEWGWRFMPESWRQFNWPGDPITYDLFVRRIGSGGTPLLAPGTHRS